MLLMVEKGILGEICHSIYRSAKANNKYMKNCETNIKSSYLMYLDGNNLYEWAMSQKLLVNGFEWVGELSDCDERFIKNYDENSEKGYFLEVDVEYPKNFFNLHNDSLFLPKRKKTEKCKELVCNIHNKENYIIHIRTLKQALNHGLIIKKYTK